MFSCNVLLAQEDCCECNKWEKTTRVKKHRYNATCEKPGFCSISAHFDEEEKTEYRTGCYQYDGYKYIGADPNCCENVKKQNRIQAIADEKARIAQVKDEERARLEQIRFEKSWEKNKQKHLSKDGFIVDEWYNAESALPHKGHKGMYFREWEESNLGNAIVKGEIINGKKENIWEFKYQAPNSFLDESSIKIENQGNQLIIRNDRYSINSYIGVTDPKEIYENKDLWIYFKNDELLYVDIKAFSMSEVEQKINARNERELEKNMLAEKNSKNNKADEFIKEAKGILLNISKIKNNSKEDENFMSTENYKREIENSIKDIKNALNFYSNDKIESINYAKSKLALANAYLDTINSINDIEFDLAIINPKENNELKKQIINNIQLAIYENCVVKIKVLVKSNNLKRDIYIENYESEGRNSQIKNIIKNINLTTSIKPIYYFGSICKTKTTYNLELNANSNYKKFIVINESNIKMKGFNINNSSITSKNLTLKENYNKGVELLKDKPNGKYYYSITDFKINGVNDHKEYLSKFKSYGGSANCLYSLIIPGLGKMAITRGRKGWGDLIAVATFGAATYYVNDLKNKSYEKYKNANEQVDMDKYYQEATQYNLGAWSLGVIGGYIWLLDIVEVYNTGEKNKQNERDFKRHFGKFTYGVSISNINQKMYPSIGLKYKMK